MFAFLIFPIREAADLQQAGAAVTCRCQGAEGLTARMCACISSGSMCGSAFFENAGDWSFGVEACIKFYKGYCDPDRAFSRSMIRKEAKK